ncbi:MAG: S8 family serine peptidase [Acidimicrobiales bacterium]
MGRRPRRLRSAADRPRRRPDAGLIVNRRSFPTTTSCQGDVMASFSSRGPGGQFLKPDITAPGVQVLAGNTPTPDEVPGGPPGQYYQAIAGTSMSSPHAAGSAILLEALHPAWTPGRVKSALMTTAKTSVLKEDLTTPADPFDMGAGRVDLTRAGSPPIVFDETAANMFALGPDPLTALDINSPSINVPTMPGTVTVTRTATNVSSQPFSFDVSTTAPAGSTIKVSPAKGRIPPGASQALQVTITSNAPTGQYFGQIDLTSKSTDLHLPVAFFNQQGNVTLTQSCDPSTIQVRGDTTCEITASNGSTGDTSVSIESTVSKRLGIVAATGATVSPDGTHATAGPVTLAAPEDATPAIAPGDTPGGGFLDLADFGISPQAIGDEQNVNFSVPTYQFGDRSYSRIGVDSNGYVSVGGSDSASDISFEPQTFPDATPPNGVLAPYWTDLNGSGAPGIRVGVLAGPNSWIVVQWNTHVYSDATATGARSMQVWIGTGATQDISYAYGADTLGKGTPSDGGVTVGAENVTGTAGAQISGPPTESYVVTSTPGSPGGSATVTLTVRGFSRGDRSLTSSMLSDQVAGTTVVTTPISVTRRTPNLELRLG